MSPTTACHESRQGTRDAFRAASSAFRAASSAFRAAGSACSAALSLLVVATLALAPVGCSSDPAGTPVIDEVEAQLDKLPRTMRVTSAYGGAHRRMLIEGNTWYQTFANRVLLLDSQTGTQMSEVELAPRGTTGPAADLALLGTRLFVVLEDDAVVELDVSTPRTPRYVARWARPELGIAPRRIARIGDEMLVSGDGGVIRLSEAPAEGTTKDDKGRAIPPVPPARMLDGMIVGTVVDADGGPVGCVGRRILRLADGSYLGAASMLLPVPAEYGGGFAFALQASEGAEVGLMGANFRERSSSAVRGTVHAIRICDERFVAVTDTEATTWKFELAPGPDTVSQGEGYQLGTSLTVAVRGARDVGKVKRNRFAVAGSFGRALYRYLPEGDKPGDTFYWTERMPGRLDVAVTDRRRVLAAGVEGSWMYLIGESAELVERDISTPDPQSPTAEVAWGTATSDERREEVVFRIGDRSIGYRPSRGGLVSTLAAADGRVWIGHDHGIDVIGYDAVRGEIVAEDRIVLAGPMIGLFPNRVGGGVSYVSRFDGFGVVRPMRIDQPPVLAPGTVRGYPEFVAPPPPLP